MEVSIHVTDSCNLNCHSCMHMVPLSAGINYYIEDYIRPQLQLLQKHKNIIHKLNIMGGEPTLHPHIISILYIFREYFPDTEISLATNGTTLNIFKDKYFISALKYTNIFLSISKYHFSNNSDNIYNALLSILNENNVPYKIADIPVFHTKFFDKTLHNDLQSNKWCKMFHYCTILKDFKLYVCNLAAYADLLKNKFEDLDWLNIDDGAYIDLRNSNLTDEYILQKMRTYSSICEHCMEFNREWNCKGDETVVWKKSSLSKDEWIKE